MKTKWFFPIFIFGATFALAEEEIYYDTGLPYAYFLNCMPDHSCFAMKFTPSADCKVVAGKVKNWIVSGSAKTCTLFVFNDDSGVKPKYGGKRTSAAYMPVHAHTEGWKRVDFPQQISYSAGEEFWIVMKLYPRNGDCVGAVTDKEFNYKPRNVYGDYTLDR